jgi:hypothetical protein
MQKFGFFWFLRNLPILYALLNCLQCLAKCCQTIGQKDEKTSTGCRKGAGSLFLCLRATGGKKRQFFRRKLAKMVENCDHNSDPRSAIERRHSERECSSVL